MTTAFLTYRQQNPKHTDHKEKVREFALRLRSHGVKVILDQLANEEQFAKGGPPDPNGWAGWSYSQVENADKVLIIGSVAYFRIYENKEVPGVGLGSAIEAQRIFQQLYNAKGQNGRFRIVILGDGDDECVPDHLSGYHRFYPNRSPSDFEDLICWLKGSPDSKCTTCVNPKVIWPKAIEDFQPNIANRKDEFAFFTTMLAGLTVERSILFEAPSNHGKTTLLAECVKYAAQVLPRSAYAKVDFKVNGSKEFALETIRLDLNTILPNFSRSGGTVGDLRQDFRTLSSPVLLVFDTFEKSSQEAMELVNTLLADLENCPAIRIVIAGQNVPDHSRSLWAGMIQHFYLGPIPAPHWALYASQHYPQLTEDHIEAITTISGGVPGTQLTFMKAVAKTP